MIQESRKTGKKREKLCEGNEVKKEEKIKERGRQRRAYKKV